MWNCHVDESAKNRYEMIIGRYILKLLGVNLKLSEHVIEAYYRPLKGPMTPMVDMGTYAYKILNT